MKEKERLSNLEKIVTPEITAMGYELIDMAFSGGILRITIDKPGGINLDDCVSVNRRVSLLLDTLDPIEGSYRLEVSSPGLYRRLKTVKEFEHFVGRMVKVQISERSYRGKIKGLAGDAVLLDVEGSEISLPLKDIVKANLDFDF